MRFLYFGILALTLSLTSHAQEHPRLILTKAGVAEIRANLGKVPFFDTHLAQVKKEVDAAIAKGIDIPVPKDMAGGYTHERHKQNFFLLQKAGVLYQLLNEEKYAQYVKEMFMEYAEMYPTLPIHPQPRSYARGKLFWQCLNDSNWLVYASQAYDCVYEYLSKKERTHLETQLFKPFARFLSIENPQFYNRIHNHSTWGNAAVGMIALVMDDEELLQSALKGLSSDQIALDAKDNDGGFIKDPNGKAGFLANIDAPFSPDGYYTEAPYYQRYAMYPYLLFAVGLQNARPDIQIFDYKDGVLLKAVDALLNLTDTDGEFYPLNDAQKGMSYYSRELVAAVSIAYHYGAQHPGLLSIAQQQGRISLDDAGFSIAKAISEGKAVPFSKTSRLLTDGPQGKQGGIAILRSGEAANELNLVMKYTAQGNSHGHYDKLATSLYFRGEEVLQDYGLARFVNIDQKNGGGYLKENKTWAKQTIAHNTLVVDEKSHYNGSYKEGSQNHAEYYFSDLENEAGKVISAKAKNTYPGVGLQRTLFLLNDKRLDHPLMVDLFAVNASTAHQYDLPFHYFGQIMSSSLPLISEKTLTPLGKSFGYQHLWKRATASAEEGTNQLSWFSKNVFHTLTLLNSTQDQLLFAQLGANDPEFNLRNDPSLILRRQAEGETLFVSTLETHGSYSPVSEIAKNATSSLQSLSVLHHSLSYTVVQINFKSGQPTLLLVSNNDPRETQEHQIKIHNQSYQWVGPYQIINQTEK